MFQILKSIPSRGKDSWESIRTAGVCLTVMIFAAGSVRSSGVIYYGVLTTFNASRQDASWPVSLMGAMLSLSSVVCGPLAQRFSPRPVIIGGSLLAAVSMISCYFVKSVGLLTFTFGFSFGLGLGSVYTCNVIFLQQYFEKYRSFAIGVNYTGSTIASFVFPAFFDYLRSEYGFQGSLLIIGSLLLNMFAMTLLHKEPWWLSETAKVRSRTLSLLNSASGPQPPPIKEDVSKADDTDQVKSPSRSQGKPEGARVSVRDALSVLTEPMYYVILISISCFMYAYDAYLTTIFDFAIDKGIPHERAVTIFSFCSVTDMIGRLTLPNLAGCYNTDKKLFICLNYTLVAVMMCMLPFAPNFTVLTVLAMTLTLFIGSCVVLYGVSLAEYIGIARLPMAYCLLGLACGSTYFTKPFYIGYFRDTVESYEDMYRWNGLFCGLGGLCWFLAYIGGKIKSRKQKSTDHAYA